MNKDVAEWFRENRPSKLFGPTFTTAGVGSAGAVGGAGAVGNAAGLYTLTHAATGATMLGSTAGGVSAAGTVGIMGGTAGPIAAAVGAVVNPVVWVPLAATAAVGVAWEGGAAVLDYFSDEAGNASDNEE